MADLTPSIEQKAARPRETEIDGVRTQARDLRELIDADRYLKQSVSSSQPYQGLRFAKIVPPGAV